MSYPNADISFPGLFGDWRFTLSPKLLDIGNGIYWYGVLIAAGLLIALWFCMKRAPRYGLTEDDVIDTVLWAIPFAIVGARVYYVLFYLDQFRLADGSIDWAETYRIWDGGLAIYGGSPRGIFDRVARLPKKAAQPLGACRLLRGGLFHRTGHWPLGQLLQPRGLRRHDRAAVADAAVDQRHLLYRRASDVPV